jgi:hypothetical protein
MVPPRGEAERKAIMAATNAELLATQVTLDGVSHAADVVDAPLPQVAAGFAQYCNQYMRHGYVVWDDLTFPHAFNLAGQGDLRLNCYIVPKGLQFCFGEFNCFSSRGGWSMDLLSGDILAISERGVDGAYFHKTRGKLTVEAVNALLRNMQPPRSKLPRHLADKRTRKAAGRLEFMAKLALRRKLPFSTQNYGRHPVGEVAKLGTHAVARVDGVWVPAPTWVTKGAYYEA